MSGSVGTDREHGPRKVGPEAVPTTSSRPSPNDSGSPESLRSPRALPGHRTPPGQGYGTVADPRGLAWEWEQGPTGRTGMTELCWGRDCTGLLSEGTTRAAIYVVSVLGSMIPVWTYGSSQLT